MVEGSRPFGPSGSPPRETNDFRDRRRRRSEVAQIRITAGAPATGPNGVWSRRVNRMAFPAFIGSKQTSVPRPLACHPAVPFLAQSGKRHQFFQLRRRSPGRRTRSADWVLNGPGIQNQIRDDNGSERRVIHRRRSLRGVCRGTPVRAAYG